MAKQNINWHQVGWAAELAEFNFLFHYRKGSTMGKSDILLRCPGLKQEVKQDNTNQITLLVHQFVYLHALTTGTLGLVSRNDLAVVLRNRVAKEDNCDLP